MSGATGGMPEVGPDGLERPALKFTPPRGYPCWPGADGCEGLCVVPLCMSGMAKVAGGTAPAATRRAAGRMRAAAEAD